jgi:hypothetical protein
VACVRPSSSGSAPSGTTAEGTGSHARRWRTERRDRMTARLAQRRAHIGASVARPGEQIGAGSGPLGRSVEFRPHIFRDRPHVAGRPADPCVVDGIVGRGIAGGTAASRHEDPCTRLVRPDDHRRPEQGGSILALSRRSSRHRAADRARRPTSGNLTRLRRKNADVPVAIR